LTCGGRIELIIEDIPVFRVIGKAISASHFEKSGSNPAGGAMNPVYDEIILDDSSQGVKSGFPHLGPDCFMVPRRRRFAISSATIGLSLVVLVLAAALGLVIIAEPSAVVHPSTTTLTETSTSSSTTTATQTTTLIIEKNTTLTTSANITVADGVFVVPPESQLLPGFRANSRGVGNNQTGLLLKDFEVTNTTHLEMYFGPGSPIGPGLSPLDYQVAVLNQNNVLYETSVIYGTGNVTLTLPPGDTSIVAINLSSDFTMLVFLDAYLY